MGENNHPVDGRRPRRRREPEYQPMQYTEPGGGGRMPFWLGLVILLVPVACVLGGAWLLFGKK